MSFGVTDNMDDYLPPFRWGRLRPPYDEDRDIMEDEDTSYYKDYDDMVKAMNQEETPVSDDYPDEFFDISDMDDSDIQR